jgi:hypothetical protein
VYGVLSPEPTFSSLRRRGPVRRQRAESLLTPSAGEFPSQRKQRFAAFAKRQDELFKEKVPAMADPAKVAELQSGALAVLTEHGFEEAELAASWHGQKDFSLRDHRIQLVVRDAILWREANAKAKAAVAKPLPPVQRPGTSRPKGAAQEAVIQNLSKKLDASGSLRDATALLKARRAAR